ncbi:DUF4251 domain-containing protein [Mucilaginibacter sp. OK098]|uniref:DUF4251 domain-containing protein n=1 Tax=Mucilaginibacter sp. OK098 TaxID=1855297 RepID=UPI00091FC673|nr:DUF4251 domain-containing protein [Mucilaginibacter sp. OK098]SHM08581.1 protein of unknown function [Mucilaginibacter sp. OK098]
MKTLIKLFFVVAILAGGINITNAQTTKKEKQAAKAAKIKALLDSHNYVFNANYVIPQRGNSRSTNYGYDLVVSKDTVTAYLPYFGRVTIAPSDPSDGGVKFTSTNFDYTTKQAKNGSYDVTITPKDAGTQGSKDVRYLRLNVSTSGYASLQVISNNRDPISYNGDIEERKAKK